MSSSWLSWVSISVLEAWHIFWVLHSSSSKSAWFLQNSEVQHLEFAIAALQICFIVAFELVLLPPQRSYPSVAALRGFVSSHIVVIGSSSAIIAFVVVNACFTGSFSYSCWFHVWSEVLQHCCWEMPHIEPSCLLLAIVRSCLLSFSVPDAPR